MLPHFPTRSAYSAQYQALGFNMTMGGGFGITFAPAFAWLVLDVNYSHSWLPSVHGIDASQSVQSAPASCCASERGTSVDQKNGRGTSPALV
jgi:hypothetical protein